VSNELLGHIGGLDDEIAGDRSGRDDNQVNPRIAQHGRIIRAEG
jgi:hypothetical protein